jgi:hypothetical protein
MEDEKCPGGPDWKACFAGHFFLAVIVSSCDLTAIRQGTGWCVPGEARTRILAVYFPLNVLNFFVSL